MRSVPATLALLCTTLAGAACAPGLPRAQPPIPVDPDYRIVAMDAGTPVTMEEMVRRARAADVVLFGEFHDDPITHRVQLDLLRHLVSASVPGTLALEMFERDVAPILTDYGDGRIAEDQMIASARPWPNYREDYRPLVELARASGWRIVATNLPQSQATLIARGGLAALEDLPPAERSLAAARMECPRDEYWTRFLEAIEMGTGADGQPHPDVSPMIANMYQAQCARDETMAETIAALPGDRLTLHINGSFHSDFRLGIVPRLLRRAPDLDVVVLSAVPIDDLGDPPVADHRGRADFVIFTRKPDSTAPAER